MYQRSDRLLNGDEYCNVVAHIQWFDIDGLLKQSKGT